MAVLDAAARVQEFELDEDIGGAPRYATVQVQHGRLTHQLGHVLGDFEASDLGGLHKTLAYTGQCTLHTITRVTDGDSQVTRQWHL